MDRMTQQNAAMVEESTAASRSLAGESDDLAALVSHFRLKVGSRPLTRSSGPRASVATPRAPVSGNLALAVDNEAEWADF